jgi:hypothetical protein
MVNRIGDLGADGGRPPEFLESDWNQLSERQKSYRGVLHTIFMALRTSFAYQISGAARVHCARLDSL